MDRRYYQTGGITMANTLQQNLAANQAQATGIQAMLNAARKRAGLPTTAAPSITKSSPTPDRNIEITQKVDPRVQTTPTPNLIPGALGDAELDLGPIANMRAPGGMTNEDFMKLSTTEQDKVMANENAQMIANRAKYTQADGSEGTREMYMNILDGIRNENPNEFAKLTGNETLADLEKIFYPQYFNPDGSYMTNEQFRQTSGMKKGGRAGYQTGGITESRTLPPEFVEAAQRTFLTDLATQAGMPSVTTATAKQPGETDAQFAQRQAQATQFGITKAGMAELAPQVAAQDPLQAAAYAQAVDPTKGLGSFQPFLTKATTAADATTPLTGTGAGTGAGSIQSYMSPYQQQVIDTTLADFDKQAQIRQNQLAASALGTPGAFGGGREGVQRAEYQATSDMNRAQTLANLRQSGFQNAAARRQQDLANQMNISQLQSGLGARAQDFSRAQISGLGTLGAAQQAQNQAILDAQRQASQMAIDEPRQALSRFGQGIAAITPGAGSVQIGESQAAAGASPLMKALGLGLVGADIYGRIFQCLEL